ncbi:MAG: DMT family transporter [Bacteroidota bacterium]
MMQQKENSPWFVHPALLTVGLIYAGAYSIAKIALGGYVPPFGFALLRVFFATIVLSIVHALTVKEKVTDKKDLWLLAKCGLFGAALNQLLFLKGLSLTTAVNSSIIMTLIPVMVLIFSFLLLGENVGWRKVMGIVLALIGAVILLYKDDFGLSNDTLMGDLLNFLNAASYALYLVLVKPLMKKYHSLTVIKWVFIFSFIFVLPFGFSDILAIEWVNFTPAIWGSVAYVILAATILVYWLNVVTLKYVSPAIVGVYIYLQPLFATVIAIFAFGESFQLKQLLATLLIFAGVYFVNFSATVKKKST